MNQNREYAAISLNDTDVAAESEATAGAREKRPKEPLLLKAGEVATLLGLGRSTIFALLAAGELPVIRIGRSVRVPRRALECWIEERTGHGANRAVGRRPFVRGLGGWRSGE